MSRLRVGLHGMTTSAPRLVISSRRALGLVGDHMVGVEALEEQGCLRGIAALSGSKDDAYRPPLAIDSEVDLGGQSSSGAPQSLTLVPPFPVAACWWARTRLLSSIRYSLSGAAVRLANTFSQTPA